MKIMQVLIKAINLKLSYYILMCIDSTQHFDLKSIFLFKAGLAINCSLYQFEAETLGATHINAYQFSFHFVVLIKTYAPRISLHTKYVR